MCAAGFASKQSIDAPFDFFAQKKSAEEEFNTGFVSREQQMSTV